MSTFDEKDLIARLQDESTRRAAFEELVNRYSKKLYWQVRHLVVDHEDSDDVLQNVFLKVWNSIGNFKGDSQLFTWLYRIAYNESITFLNKKKSQVSIDDIDDGIANRLESDAYFDGDETQILLQEAISILPEKQRAVFTMKYFDEMKYEDMADITGTSVGALKASYHIAVQKISTYIRAKEL
ncbi:MAG: sigma-70 family RNA polymerase sigma factor [Bacteroidaceae bacterium]|nr:sigma-70 family RNA polymerase sigma factor [Bacteroidaceae bacterium]